MSLEESLKNLMDGNERFVKQHPQDRNISKEIINTKDGVDPYAVVISCMDARVIPEQIFDTKIGDILTLRVGGGVINQDILDSIDIATNVANIRVVMLLGHTKCGAIVNAIKNRETGVSQLIGKVLPAIDSVPEEIGEPSVSNTLFLRKAEEIQVNLSIQQLRTSIKKIDNLVNDNLLMLVGAMYDVETGNVNIL
jgi:carbonic anhydrase